MKERPILFSGAMVRALLDGRKTQTRRDATDRISDGKFLGFPGSFFTRKLGSRCKYTSGLCSWECPYGQPGDRLWVRETFRIFGGDEYAYQKRIEDVRYCASSEAIDHACSHWKPSIFMPRWASRLTLDIVSVRVDRLNDISEDDAKAEGVTPIRYMENPFGTGIHSARFTGEVQSAYNAYRDLWEQINGTGSWSANPWVWVIEFRRI